MPSSEIILDLISRIKIAKERGAFRNYIEYIRFPFYKNLEPNTKITFDYPFTVFTGQNGSGKSSTLHAIQGSPGGESPTKFWYSTPIDPINDQNNQPHCFIYGYYRPGNNEILEVLKTRINLANNPDYWEPSRPLRKYGMTLMEGRRNPTITKNLIYHDFRAELSAYDKFFYFGEFGRTQTIQSKQDYIRRYSWKLKRIIDHNTIEYFRGSAKNEHPITLNQDALEIVSNILGKKYTECKIIKHSWFKNQGATIYFKTDALKYSEAFAGRGEYAVVKIVHEILQAPNYSLVVLDEPEVSLHPGAQEQLKIFLLQQTLRKQLQVVISTHSPTFIEYLPEEAIKLFYLSPTEKISVKNATHPLEAFNFIGEDNNDKKRIYVEDKVAQLLLERIIKTVGGRYEVIFEVVYFPGGASEIYKKAAVYSEEEENRKFLLLDGDQNKIKIDPTTISLADAENFDALSNMIRTVSGIEFRNFNFRIDSEGNAGNIQQKISACLNYLRFIWTNLSYLPGNSNPESLIWNSEFANATLNNIGVAAPNFGAEAKDNFLLFAELYFGDKLESSILSAQKLFISEFCRLQNDDYTNIIATLDLFIDVP